MSDDNQETRKALKMVECGRCKVKNFIPSDLPPFKTASCARCGHPVMMPTLMRQFELRSIIASGGMGTVYRAWDTKLQRNVALKMMKKEMARDPEVMESFYREARAGAALNHTNIIHIYSFDEFEGHPYLVMELADAGSLDSWIEREQRVPELNVLDAGIGVTLALNKALQHNLLHRDIKPGNILYNDEGEPKLIDFGLARKAEAENTDETSVWGTPYYVAPEKIRREAETFLSDMYSLGGTLYHALTGHVPFEAPTIEDLVAAQVYTPLTAAIEVVPDISQKTSDAIGTCMAKDPRQRFAKYDDLHLALTIARSEVLIKKFQDQ